MKTAHCPDLPTLQTLLLGKIRCTERTSLEEHLLHCDHCVAQAEALLLDDELLEISRGATPVPNHDPEMLSALIQRIKDARFQAETVQVTETLPGNGSDFASSRGPSPLTCMSFLRPAEQSDELGRLGDYRVLQVMGAGGMGVVLRAEDTRLRRQVAIKMMKPSIAESADAKRRFLREAQATAALEHDNIVAIYQVGEVDGVPFIAMQYLKGESLKTRLDRLGKLSPAEVVRIGKEIASGLAKAHEHGLIHRDIKPDNVWLEEKTNRAKILDFGLVSAAAEDEGLTHAGEVLGTPRYMSPEQALAHSIDHRADIFSLGSLLYHAASGETPFSGNGVTATLIAVAHTPPKSLRDSAPDLPASLADLIMQLLEKNPDQRPQSAGEIADRLAGIEQELRGERNVQLVKETASETFSDGDALVALAAPPATPPRLRGWVLAAAGGFAALVLGLIVITVQHQDGSETTIRVSHGVAVDVAVQPGSKVSIREEAGGGSDALGSAVMNVPQSGRAGVRKKQLWPVGPLPSWASAEPRWSILKEGPVIPGAVERPTEFKGIGRWNVDTVHSRGQIQVARYSPDGDWLATGSTDGHVRVYRASTMKLHQLLPGIGGSGGVVDLSWHPDSQRIAVAADNDKTLRIWTIQGRLLLEELTHEGYVSSVAWTFDGSRLICGGRDRLELRNPDGRLLKQLIDDPQIPGCDRGNISVSPNSQRFVCWHQDAARIWNAETSKVEHTIDLACTSSSLSRIRWSKKDQIFLGLSDRLVICGSDGKVQTDLKSESLCAAAWRPDGENLTIWRDDLYDLNPESGESTPANDRIFLSAASGMIPTAIDWSPDGQHLVIAAGCLAVCNEELNKIEFNSGTTVSKVSGISLNPSGTQIASISDFENGVRIWSSSGTAQHAMSLNESLYETRVAWSPDGRHIAVLSLIPGRLHIGEPEGRLREVDGRYSTFGWSPDGTQLVTGTPNGQILILDKNGQTLHSIDTGESSGVNVGWSKQGMLVAHVGKRVLRIRPDSAESKVSLLTEVPGTPLDNLATWRPDGGEVFFPGAFHVNVADGVTERVRQAPAAAAWAPDGSRYLQLEANSPSLHRPDGTPIMARGETVSHYYVAAAWSPSGETVYIGYDQSLLMARNADDLHVKWTGVMLPNQKSITFDVGGSVLDADRETIDNQIVYYSADEAGNVSLLSPTEFESKIGKEIHPVP